MTWEAAILYAHQRMREIGKTSEQYHFEPVRVSANRYEKKAGYLEISAFNDIYIIVNPQNYYGVFILGDNSAFNSDEASQSGAPEFTGLIRIHRIGNTWNLEPQAIREFVRPVPLEFLRVVIY